MINDYKYQLINLTKKHHP